MVSVIVIRSIMKQKQILEGNNLIAEFMGYKVRETGDTTSDSRFGVGTWFLYTKDGVTSDNVFFNSSWDWLMPVVEKIEKLGYHTRICFDDFGSWMQIHYGLSVADTDETKAVNMNGKTKIENTFKSVVEFIKWYNKNGKPNRKK